MEFVAYGKERLVLCVVLASHELVVDVGGKLGELLLAESGELFASIGTWRCLFHFGEMTFEEAEQLNIVRSADSFDFFGIWSYTSIPGNGWL